LSKEFLPFTRPSIDEDTIAGVVEVLRSGWITSGPQVREFEARLSDYFGGRPVRALSSATGGMEIGLALAGVGPGDEVITQADTFIATVAAVMYTGARPVLVDVVAPSFTIDVAAVEAVITPATKAILPVHLFGQPCDLDALRVLADEHGLVLIEDASQAHGARYKGATVGATGTVTFSFYPGKNLGACGEGGAVVTDDVNLAEQVRLLRNHGSKEKYRHDVLGFNFRLEGIQGAVLDVKTRYLDEWTKGRRRVATEYDALLDGIERPRLLSDTASSYHIYPVFVRNRDAVRASLSEAGIETNVHYPIPCHLQPGYTSLGYTEGAFPQSERIAREELSLPIFPEMTSEQVRYVAAHLRQAVS
jgi:dTDP-4-amino-4,6-dideoxygalactose transaminase